MSEVHITPARIREAIRKSVIQEVKRQETAKVIKARRITESIMKTIKGNKQTLTESANGEKRVNLTATDLRNMVNEAVLKEWEDKNLEGTTLETFDYSQIPADLAVEADNMVRKLWEEGDGSQSLECHVDYTLEDGVVEVSCTVEGQVDSWYDAGNFYDRAPEGDTRTTCTEITDLEINVYDDTTNEYWPKAKVDEKVKDLDFSDLYEMVDKEF